MESLQILESLREFDTALLANTIECISSVRAHEYYLASSIRSVTPSLCPTVGVAVTCEMDSSTPTGESDLDGYWQQIDSMKTMQEPAIWVVKTVGSRADHECVLGDGMAKTLYAAGCIGVVTDGGVRDVPALMSVPFAAYCKGTTIHHCALRVRSINQQIELGGITIYPGDVIHANAEGVIKVPQDCLNELATKASQMQACEREAHCILRRTDLASADKRKKVKELFVLYGFVKSSGGVKS